jgi:hypothetical protein
MSLLKRLKIITINSRLVPPGNPGRTHWQGKALFLSPLHPFIPSSFWAFRSIQETQASDKVSACFNTISTAWGSISGGYLYLRKIRFTNNRRRARIVFLTHVRKQLLPGLYGNRAKFAGDELLAMGSAVVYLSSLFSAVSKISYKAPIFLFMNSKITNFAV